MQKETKRGVAHIPMSHLLLLEILHSLSCTSFYIPRHVNHGTRNHHTLMYLESDSPHPKVLRCTSAPFCNRGRSFLDKMAHRHHDHDHDHHHHGRQLADVTPGDVKRQADRNARNHPRGGKQPRGTIDKPVDWLAPTRWAPAYRSVFTRLPKNDEIVVPLIKHVNCSYLSTRGIVPSLLDLKQHAQSLVILIKNITVSSLPGMIDNENAGVAGAFAFNEAETFDFLNDLTVPYEGPTRNPAFMRSHMLPLTSLANVLEQTSHAGGAVTLPDGTRHVNDDSYWVQNICPMHRAPDTEVKAPGLPYSTIEALVEHANEVLERLDHEYSAKGGLLGILPPKEEKENRALAESTLLGQMILYIQRLVDRLHNLERLYANAMDTLATEAVAVHQALSALGPDGRQPREMVYPQDRFVLVNAGENVWNYLTQAFDQQDIIEEKVAQNYKSKGFTGEALWRTGESGKIYSRGITKIDVTTRYYRIREDPLKTIFVIPAHEKHPGVAATLKMEKEPTVVSVVKPTWPERTSQWEMKHREELHQARLDRGALRSLQATMDQLKMERDAAVGSKATARAKVRVLEADIDALLEGQKDPDANLKKCADLMSQFHAKENQLAEERKQFAEQKRLFAEREKALQQAEDDNATRAQLFLEQQNARVKKDNEEAAARAARLTQMDRDAATAAHALNDRLSAMWRKQLQDVAVLKAHLTKNGVVHDPHDLVDPLTPGASLEIDQQIDNVMGSAVRAGRTATDTHMHGT